MPARRVAAGLAVVAVVAVVAALAARGVERFTTKQQCKYWFRDHFRDNLYHLQLPAARGKRELALFDILFWQGGKAPINMCRWHAFFTDRLHHYALPWRGVRATDGLRWTLRDDIKSLDWTLLEQIAAYAVAKQDAVAKQEQYTWDMWCTTRNDLLRAWRRGALRRARPPSTATDLPSAWRLDNRSTVTATPFRPYFYEQDLDTLHDQGYTAPIVRARRQRKEEQRLIKDDIVFDALGEATTKVRADRNASTHIHFVATTLPTSALRATDIEVRESDVAMPLMLPQREDRDLHFHCQRPWHTCQSRDYVRA